MDKWISKKNISNKPQKDRRREKEEQKSEQKNA